MTLSPIKLARMKRGLRQMDVAGAVGISESKLSRIETGRMEPDNILLGKIAGALNVPAEELQPARAE